MVPAAPSDVVSFIESWVGLAHLNSPGAPSLTVGATQCRAALALLESVPARLFVLSPADRTRLIAADAALRGIVDTSPASFTLNALYPFGETAPKIIWGVMKKCPDELPDPKFQTLAFIPDDKLRASIETDVGAAHSALSHDELKAATVLAGAAIEALLLWALQDARVFPQLAGLTDPPAPTAPADLEGLKWGLGGYIKAAVHVGLLDATTQKQLELAADYRNLIHPGRSKRKAAECNRGTAHGAIAGLELLIPILATRLP